MSHSGGTVTNANRPGWALGLCDRCGFAFKLNQLRAETYDMRLNGLLVCRTCLDQDQPQLQLGKQKIFDPQSLFDPRPDNSRQGSVTLFGWQPVGNPLNFGRVVVNSVVVV